MTGKSRPPGSASPSCTRRRRVTARVTSLAIGIAVGTALAPLRAAAQTAPTAYEQLQTFSGVVSQIRVNYVDSVDMGSLVRAAINGMLRSLDPHSRYVSQADFELRARYEHGQLGGTGLAVEEAEGALVVLGVEAKSPAARAGIQSGDRIRRLNDSSVAGLSASDIETRLLGEKGSKLRLTLERGARLDPDTFAVTLKRDFLSARAVAPPRMLDATTAYVQLAEFTPGSPRELKDALGKARGMGARQLVLDLRGNPGGNVDAMVDIASLFLPAHSEVFHTQGRKKTGLDSVATKQAGDFLQLPLVLLVDRGSASASEMLSGSLQDHDRALIVGRRSFGKALMQMSMPLPGGDVVWLTTARVVTPSGRLIQRRYQGIDAEQYYAMAGRSGAEQDTMAVWKTEHGRDVRGGGGIVPDVPSPRPDLPVWFSVADDSGFTTVIADSVAATLPATVAARAAWFAGQDRWDAALMVPLLSRARARFHVVSQPAPAARARIARYMAMRVAEVRWGPDAAEELALRTDPDVELALAQFPRLGELLHTR